MNYRLEFMVFNFVLASSACLSISFTRSLSQDHYASSMSGTASSIRLYGSGPEESPNVTYLASLDRLIPHQLKHEIRKISVRLHKLGFWTDKIIG